MNCNFHLTSLHLYKNVSIPNRRKLQMAFNDELDDFEKKFLESKGVDMDNLPDNNEEDEEIEIEDLNGQIDESVETEEVGDETLEEDEESNEEEVVEDEEVEDEEESDDEEDNEDLEEEVEEKPKKSDKQHKAFERLRKQGDEHKRNAEASRAEANKYRESLEKLAQMQGFASVEDFEAAVEKKRNETEAQKQGMSTEAYTEMKSLRNKVDQMEQDKVAKATEIATEKFRNSFAEVAKTYNLTDSQQEELVRSLEEDGYTSQKILGITNHTRLLKGYLPENVIAKKKIQKQLDSARTAKGSGVRKIKGSNAKKKMSARDIALADLKNIDGYN